MSAGLADYLKSPGRIQVSGAPEGYDALVILQAQMASVGRDLIFVARDEAHMVRLSCALDFFAADLDILTLPAWDCLPYDRVSPLAEIVAQRVSSLCALTRVSTRPRIVLTTINAALQRLPARSSLARSFYRLQAGENVDEKAFFRFLSDNGYLRTSTVREPGEYAVRGGIIDIYPPGVADPLRLDFFGDELEKIRSFDPMTQRSRGEKREILFQPVSEVILGKDSIALFRQRYRENFGAALEDDSLYAAISEGRRYPGMEHWLPLFHQELECLFDYLPDASLVLDFQVDAAMQNRLAAIQDYYAARLSMMQVKTGGGSKNQENLPDYKALAPDLLYLGEQEWADRLTRRPVLQLSPFAAPDNDGACQFDAGGRRVIDFAEARANPANNIFDAFAERLKAHGDKSVIIVAYSAGSHARLSSLMSAHGMPVFGQVENWKKAQKLSPGSAAFAVLEMEKGFETDSHVFYSEQDILGERLSRAPRRRKRRGAAFISEASALDIGDLVVHIEHGIGRYDGLETLRVEAAAHDCLRILYLNDDKLFVPVENIEMLSRYGSDESKAQLDKLGGIAWQARKAKIRERVKDIAEKLLRVAAERALRRGEVLTPPEGAYDAFCARFPFVETDDQLRVAGEILDDMGAGKTMDRLVCGDVGFGKTEVALRAAFVAAMRGYQVAVVVPTTLLARQHYRNFAERFAGLPVSVRQLSRLVSSKQASETRQGLADGTVNIVIGTHALLAKGNQFDNLGLLIVDEEQHFGVTQKERLKQLKTNVHVLTLTATPIPRTLQMALSGVREMSIMATPPVDRLAVRTFVLPFDPVVLREAIKREHLRGGQVFYVCPRVADLGRMYEKIRELVPEIKIATAHGKMTPAELEDVMSSFMDGKYDLLLATNIIESGLDIPTANTMIIHRADMFGLAQLYQLRGRIGRGKIRAYCYLTVPPGRILGDGARKRLEVMQTLDSLGAGFTLASHDLDIRGAGNLLGDSQSGHIKEVGVELYQKMLEEAVAAAKDEGQSVEISEIWSPVINIGRAVLIPESYVRDLSVRLSLYRRISELASKKELDAFAVEIVDRFGSFPDEVGNLLQVVRIKQLCKLAGVAKVDAGPKGALVTFRNNAFANPTGLVGLLQQQMGSLKLRPDQKLVIQRPWESPEKRMIGVTKFMRKLAEIAGAGPQSGGSAG